MNGSHYYLAAMTLARDDGLIITDVGGHTILRSDSTTWSNSDLVEDVVQAAKHVNPDGAYFEAAPVQTTAALSVATYYESFPNLIAEVWGWASDIPAEHAESGSVDRWREKAASTELVLAPAACYSLFELLAGQQVPSASWTVYRWCFRNETEENEFRLRSFRMLEHVSIGEASEVSSQIANWEDPTQAFFSQFGLTVAAVPATDAFFGRLGAIKKGVQSRQNLKTEYVWRHPDLAAPVALASLNLHESRLTSAFSIRLDNDQPSASACLAFGIDRIVRAVEWTRHHAG